MRIVFAPLPGLLLLEAWIAARRVHALDPAIAQFGLVEVAFATSAVLLTVYVLAAPQAEAAASEMYASARRGGRMRAPLLCSGIIGKRRSSRCARRERSRYYAVRSRPSWGSEPLLH